MTDLNREGLEAAKRAFHDTHFGPSDAPLKAAIRAYLAHAKPDTAALVEALTALIHDVQEWCDAVDWDRSWDNWDHHFKALAYGGLDHYRAALSTVPAKSAEGEALHARVKRIMATTPYPESMSVFTAMMQLANELCPAQWEASPPAPAGVPEGFVLVPVEPTREMMHAFWSATPNGAPFTDAYRAMLAARPADGGR